MMPVKAWDQHQYQQLGTRFHGYLVVARLAVLVEPMSVVGIRMFHVNLVQVTSLALMACAHLPRTKGGYTLDLICTCRPPISFALSIKIFEEASYYCRIYRRRHVYIVYYYVDSCGGLQQLRL
jgi:hypothetical protein